VGNRPVSAADPRSANGVGSNAQVSSTDEDPRMPLSEELHRAFHARRRGELLEDEITIDDPNPAIV
jgi:hypothetical protein